MFVAERRETLPCSSPLVMPGPTPHRTPLRRVSQGSLFALSRSGAHPNAPHGLGFLEPALAELADEAETLRANVDGLRALSASLDTFNESFASWLFVMNMNALTVEWPEVSVRSLILLFTFLFLSFFLLMLYDVFGGGFGLLLLSRHQRKHLSSLLSGEQVRSLLYYSFS